MQLLMLLTFNPLVFFEFRTLISIQIDSLYLHFGSSIIVRHFALNELYNLFSRRKQSDKFMSTKNTTA